MKNSIGIQKGLSYNEVKVGDKLIYNDGEEKFNLTVVGINELKSDGIDVTWGDGDSTFILEMDFKNGFVKRNN